MRKERLIAFLTRYETWLIALFFILLTVGVTWRVLPFFGAIGYNDAAFYWNHTTSLDDIASTYSPNYLGQNQASALFNFVPRAIMVVALSVFGLSDSTVSYLINFGVIFVASMVYYVLFKKISKSWTYGLLAGVFIVLNNLTIEHFWSGGTFYYFLALIAFALLFYECWLIHSRQTMSVKNALVVSLVTVLIVLPFYLFMFVLFLLLFGGFLWVTLRKERRKLLKYSVLIVVLILGIQSYWLLPFLYNILHVSPDLIFSGNLEGLYQGFIRVAGYTNAINFFHYFNFFSRELHQSPLHYLFYFGILAGIAATTYSLVRRKDTALLLFILFAYIVFANLAIGPKSPILGNSWDLLWQRFTFLSFFRSFTRFLVIIIPIYVFYFAVFFREISSRQKNYSFAVIGVVVVALNLVMFTGDVKGNISAVKMPEEYRNLRSHLSTETDNNIFILPNVPYEAYSWTAERLDNEPQSYLVKDFISNKPVLTNRASINLTNFQDPVLKEIFAFSNTPNFDNYDAYLQDLNVGYVLVQKDLVDIQSRRLVPSAQYSEYFNNSSSYVEVTSNDHFDLYQLRNPHPVIDGGNVTFVKTGPTSYVVTVKGLKEQELTLRRRLDTNWRLSPTNLTISCDDPYSHPNTQVKECRANYWGRYQEMRLVSGLKSLKQGLDTRTATFNLWQLNAEMIKEASPDTKVNPDGSVDATFVLYYYPQTVFLWSSLVSVLAILAPLFCIIYFRKVRREPI